MADVLLKVRVDPAKLSPRMQRLLALNPAAVAQLMQPELDRLAAEYQPAIRAAVHSTPRGSDGHTIQRRTGTLEAQTGVIGLAAANGDGSVRLELRGQSLAPYARYLERGTSRIRPWHYLARGMSPLKRPVAQRLVDVLRRYLAAN